MTTRNQESPTQEEWEANKWAIYRLYMEQSQTLTNVIRIMRADYAFPATRNMYPKQFKKWAPLFNKNNRPGADPAKLPRNTNHAPRQRSTGPAKPPKRRDMPLAILRMRSPDPHRNVEGALHSTGNYVSGLLEHFNWDDFTIITPHGMPDVTMEWQFIADKCFGATRRLLRGDGKDGWEELEFIHARLPGLLQVCHPAMMVKIWRVCHTLHQAGIQLNGLKLVYSFLSYVRDLVLTYQKENHPLFFLFDAVYRVPPHELADTLRVLYRRTIMAMESRLGPRHAITLHMWSNFLKQSDGEAMSPHDLKSRYEGLLDAARQADQSLCGSNSIAVLHGFMYTSYYNLHDRQCSMGLAVQLFDRVKAMKHPRGRPRWSLPMQGFALAAKILASIHFQYGAFADGQWVLQQAITLLDHGDSECRTRAVHLRDFWQQEVIKESQAMTLRGGRYST